jgi:hypothetical protein
LDVGTKVISQFFSADLAGTSVFYLDAQVFDTHRLFWLVGIPVISAAIKFGQKKPSLPVLALLRIYSTP